VSGQHILLVETFPCISHLYRNLLLMVDLWVWAQFCCVCKAFKRIEPPLHLLHPSPSPYSLLSKGEHQDIWRFTGRS